MGVDPNYFARVVNDIEESGELPQNVNSFSITLFAIALKMNKMKTVSLMLDYFDVPKDLTLKERIAFYHLLGYT